MRANFVMSGVGAGIRRNLTMTIALVLSTSITLFFVGAAILAYIEIDKFKSNYEGKLNVSVYLCAKVSGPPCQQRTEKIDGKATKTAKTTPEATAELANALKAYPQVTDVEYVSEQAQFDRALKTLPARSTNQSKVGDLPASFTIKLKSIDKDYNQFAKTFQTKNGVSGVQNQISTIRKLLDAINGALLFSIVIALVVLIASVLLISNTIQVAAAQRRNETSIMRLVGASRWMTELPFMIETIIATTIGGLIAFGMVAFGKHFVLNGIFQVQTDNGVIPNLDANDLIIACGSGLIAGIALSALTAFATLRLYVKL